MSKNVETIKINLRGKSKYDYNKWFVFFQKRSRAENERCLEWVSEHLPSDAYAALARWIEIYENSSQMDKIVKAKMEDARANNLDKLAVGDDDEKYYVGIIKEITRQMGGSGTSPQEFARLSANMLIARKELREIRSRRPKKGTTLDRVLTAAAGVKNMPKKRQKVRRITSIKGAMTAPEGVGGAKKKKMIPISSRGKK